MSFVQTIANLNSIVNGFVWGPPMLALLLLTGVYISVRTGFFQISHFGHIMNNTFLAIFKDKTVHSVENKKAITPFQALTTALAATVGTGNIAGVATAIALGGPGAVFWMWVSAFFGMMTNFAEKTLGIYFRYKNEKGDWIGGAMIYIERGLKCRWLALIFSGFCMLAAFGIGNMTQVNSIASGLQANFSIAPWITGIFVAVAVAMVILGGIKRIASVTEKIVPFMVVVYLVGGLVCILINFTHIVPAITSIFANAFTLQSSASGVVGYGIAVAMRRGISRGVFSNEAGLGSSVMVHSVSDVKEPVKQGMWACFEVFADTLIVCTITALVILTSGVYDMATYMGEIANLPELASPNGAALTSAAFAQTFGGLGGKFVAIALVFFAFSTILGWSYYGERATDYIFGSIGVKVYKVIFIIFVFIGSISNLELVWDISDTFNGLMAIPNLFALLLLSPIVFKITKNYINRTFHNSEEEPITAFEEK